MKPRALLKHLFSHKTYRMLPFLMQPLSLLAGRASAKQVLANLHKNSVSQKLIDIFVLLLLFHHGEEKESILTFCKRLFGKNKKTANRFWILSHYQNTSSQKGILKSGFQKVATIHKISEKGFILVGLTNKANEGAKLLNLPYIKIAV